jgi:hypothetical protein
VVERAVHDGQIELLELIGGIRRGCMLKAPQEEKERKSHCTVEVRRGFDVIGSDRYQDQYTTLTCGAAPVAT